MADYMTPVLQLLVDWGLLDVILPFMFVFTILFSILQKSKVLGTYDKTEPKKNMNAMVAFVVAFFFIASLVRVQILTAIVQKLALVLVACICVLLVTGLWGKDVGMAKFKWLFAILFVVVLLIFGTSMGWFTLGDLGIIGEWIFHPITAMAVAFFLVMAFIIREPKNVREVRKKEKQDQKKEERSKKEASSKDKSKTPQSAEPRLVQEFPKDNLYGGEVRVVWKE